MVKEKMMMWEGYKGSGGGLENVWEDEKGVRKG